jgi:hypothetical protein
MNNPTAQRWSKSISYSLSKEVVMENEEKEMKSTRQKAPTFSNTR